MRSLFLFLFFAIFSYVQSAIFFEDFLQIPGHEGQCYDKDQKTFYVKGDLMKYEGIECLRKFCLGFASEFGKVRVETHTCPAVKAGPGCTIVQDPSKPYPDCCPQIVAIPSSRPAICQSIKKDR